MTCEQPCCKPFEFADETDQRCDAHSWPHNARCDLVAGHDGAHAHFEDNLTLGWSQGYGVKERAQYGF